MLEVWQSGLLHRTQNPTGKALESQPPWVQIPPPPRQFTAIGRSFLAEQLSRSPNPPTNHRFCGRKEVRCVASIVPRTCAQNNTIIALLAHRFPLPQFCHRHDTSTRNNYYARCLTFSVACIPKILGQAYGVRFIADKPSNGHALNRTRCLYVIYKSPCRNRLATILPFHNNKAHFHNPVQ